MNLVNLEFLGGYFGNFRCFEGILVILMIIGIFCSFESFIGILVIIDFKNILIISV
jgi:hypothetical protein